MVRRKSSYPDIDKGYLNKIRSGLLIMCFSLVFPGLIEKYLFNVLNSLYESITFQDSGLLLIASSKLVLLNTVRHVPIFTGAYLIAEGFYYRFKKYELGFILPLLTIPLFYWLISKIYNISFVFGGPAYLSVLVIFILHQVTVGIKPIVIKMVIITLFIFGLDWLDIVLFLSPYGFGKGEIAVSIKEITEFIEASYFMNYLGLIFSLTIIINAFILARVVIEYYNRIALIESNRAREARIKKIEMEAVKSRYLQEVKHLVHDLKTPLVTIQGLSEVIKMMVTDARLQEHSERISRSAREMSEMISEILYQDKMGILTINELFDFIKIQLSPEIMEGRVEFSLAEDLTIRANKFRLSRAIINLIENSLKAIDHEFRKYEGINRKKDLVRICVKRFTGQVLITVIDNGHGIPEKELEQIFQVGYTTSSENTGLGLSFVKQVVENHSGSIVIKSRESIGTEARILIPEVRKKNEQDTGS